MIPFPRRLLFVLSVASLASATILGGVAPHVSSSAASLPRDLFHAPRIALPGPLVTVPGQINSWRSSNWSGYAVTGSGYTQITGSWVVPTVAAVRGYSSNWIGIDGYNNSNLIQTGTEQDYYSGASHYNAWWEILPAAETIIPTLTIHPGDHMSASIVKGAGGLWTITLTDTTTGQSFSITKSYTGPGTSAEWIEEAPSSYFGVLPLAHYGQTTFDPGTVNGVAPAFTAAESGVMAQHGVQVSTPSTPDSDADGFNAAYGSTAPAPPSS